MARITDYNLLKDINAIVERIELKMDVKYERIDARVGKLENFQTRMITIAGIVQVIATAAFTWMWQRFTREI